MTPPFSRAAWWRLAAREVWLPTASEMSELDRVAIDSGATSERALIENAGRALARHLQERFPAGRVLVLGGSGHNGADAFVAGRSLAAWGRSVRFVQCGSRLPDPDVLAGWGIDVVDSESLHRELAASDVVVDGIFGTGIETAPRREQASIIERVNRAGTPVVAADGPSGVDFTTGAVPGTAIRADLTVTFGWPKLGLVRFPARGHVGDLLCVEIGFPPPGPTPRARAITGAWASDLLGERPDDGHKGDAGYLAIVGGRSGMAGAVVLAARAAIRAGAGIVRAVSAPENREVVQTAVPEAVYVDWSDARAVDETLEWAGAVAVGPGLGTSPDGAGQVARALEVGRGSVVIDADGLNVLAGDGAARESLADRDVLLTPHPGEMARLADTTIAAVRADPLASAREMSDATGATVLLKGAPSWVATPDGRVRVSTMLSAGFASGGMGDVLTGVCGAYLAAGLDAADAATAALAVTGCAVASDVDPVGGSAADVPDALPGARAALGALEPGAWAGVLLALPAAGAARPDDVGRHDDQGSAAT